MQNVLSAILLISLLVASSQATIQVRLTADSTDLAPGESTTIHIWVQGTESGIFSLGGNVTANGPAVLTANAGSFAWVDSFHSIDLLPPKTGEPGAHGGWTAFGSGQTQLTEPSSSYGKADYVEVASYTVTAGTGNGVVDLSFAGQSVSGFKPLETNNASAIGTLTAVSIRVGNTSAPLAGDFDLDGLVSILDVLQLAQAYGSTQGEPDFDATCDLDGDGIIGIGDLLILAGNFGKTE